MGTEVLLYSYGIVCLSMIVFNIIYSIILRGNERRLNMRSGKFEKKIYDQVQRISEGKNIERRHLYYMQKKLSHINNLTAFDSVMNKCVSQEEKNHAMSDYLRQIQPLILYLAAVYLKKENLQAAYFAYFISRHKLNKHMAIDSVQDIMLEYMKKNSLYCRINTLQALCSFGNDEKIVQAIVIHDRNGAFLHDKIMTDCLLSYTGDHDKLIKSLWRVFGSLTDKTQLAILNYIRFKSGDYCDEVFAILTDKSANKELRLSAVRYFGRYSYAPAKEELIKLLSDKNTVDWEYAAISAASISGYEGDDVTYALMDAMHSSNWYIRYNAAVSLENRDADYKDLITILGGKDRYAREMIMYRLDSLRLESEQRGRMA